MGFLKQFGVVLLPQVLFYATRLAFTSEHFGFTLIEFVAMALLSLVLLFVVYGFIAKKMQRWSWAFVLPLFLLYQAYFLTGCGPSGTNSDACYTNDELNPLMWMVAMNTQNKEMLVKGERVSELGENTQRIIDQLNRQHKPQIRLVREGADTLFIGFESDTAFTQPLGTTGALWYQASVVYTLTETGRFRAVDFSFEEGDHGGLPGTRSRTDFEKDFIICD